MWRWWWRDGQMLPLGWLALALVALGASAFFLRPDGNVHVIACDVGQGDAILITKGARQVLIDGGPNEAVLSCLSQYMPFWDREIELVVLTNGDADHVTGLIPVMERYEVGRLVANNLIQETARFAAFRDAVVEAEVSVYAPEGGDVILLGGTKSTKSTRSTKGTETIGDQSEGGDPSSRRSGTQDDRGRIAPQDDRGRVEITEGMARIEMTPSTGSGSSLRFEVLWPQERLGDALVWSGEADERVLGAKTYGSDANEKSVVLQLTYGDFDALLTGDVGFPTEETLLESGKLKDIELLKVGHHGSRYSSSEEFLRVVAPEIAVVSVGKNTYGHPAEEVIELLREQDIKIMRTDEVGDIEVVSDGKRWWVAREQESKLLSY